LLIGVTIAIIFLIALPSIFTLAKIAAGLAMLSVGIIAFKVALKAISNTTKQNEADDTRDKI
jgi:F0F1-type ATP synthase membrane subunit c/vacuolar-type H+-ATPase subunit K